jgi:signal transduction histidine kinase
MFFIVLPLVITLPTSLNLIGIDINYCDAEEGFIAKYYSYGVEIFSAFWILFYAFSSYYKNPNPNNRKQIVLSTMGIMFFLLAFSFGNIFSSFSEEWNYSQFGLFSMPILIGILTYLVVKYNSFNIKLVATQVLVWGLAILIGSQFFFIKIPINFVLNGFTFIASIIFGYFLIKSVKKEIEQKERLAQLNISLEESIKQRESLVHLVTHKVKGSFTRSKYIFAGMLDGTFGNINEEVKKRAGQGLESDNMGIETVDLVLNVANMQKGIVKYDMKNVNFKELVLKSIEDKKAGMEAKGLKVELEIKDGVYNILGDSVWLREAVNNLIENSIKYTGQGKIIVGLEDGNGKIKLYVKDTGVGITEEDKKNLFTEGGRGKDSVKVNVDSTGYGLYSVKLIVEAHKGRVWAESEGAGKGSQFYIELPSV